VIIYLLIFLTPFVVLLSALPSTLARGIDGFWATASWTLSPLGPATLPLPILVGQGAFHLVPFGSPAFRLNIAGAFLAALTVPLAFHALTLAKPRSAPGPTLFELDDERKWSTILLIVLTLWFFSPSTFRLGTTGLFPAIHLFFPVLALERFLAWSRSSPRFGRRWINGLWAALAGGMALTLDLRWGLLLPGLVALHRSIRIEVPVSHSLKGRHPNGVLGHLFRWILAGTTLSIAYILPWILLTAFQVATVDQLVNELPSLLTTNLLSISKNPTPFLLIWESFRTALQIVTWAGPPIALWGIFNALRSDRSRGSGLLFLWLFGAVLIPLLPGRNPSAFPVVGCLFLSLLFAGGIKSLSSRLTRGPAAAFFLLPFALLSWMPFRFPSPPTVESETADLFRSLPENSVLAWSRPDTAGAVLYAQKVLGKRRDITLLPDPTPFALPAQPGRPFYVESPDLLAHSGSNVTPVGFVFHPSPLDSLSSAFDTVSQGRMAVLLAETQPPAPLLSEIYERMGRAFDTLQIPDQAEEMFFTALAVDPSNGKASEALGQLFLKYGHTQRAPAAFARAGRFILRTETLLTDWANAERLNGQTAESIALLREALDKNKGNTILRSQLADLYERTGQTKSAVTQWRILSAQNPTDKEILWRLTQSLVKAGEFDRAHHNLTSYLNFDLQEEEREVALALKTSLEETPAPADAHQTTPLQ
jgi:hypothetical protein